MMLPKLDAGVSRGLVRDAGERGLQPSTVGCCVTGVCSNGISARRACTDANDYNVACARAGYGIANTCGGPSNIDSMSIRPYGCGYCLFPTGACGG
ncbi:MAG TPA: hypothetical protein VG826_14220 [Pirellulales bacterium]|nr:hypothetical protein [Pirellulales bacterium]